MILKIKHSSELLQKALLLLNEIGAHFVYAISEGYVPVDKKHKPTPHEVEEIVALVNRIKQTLPRCTIVIQKSKKLNAEEEAAVLTFIGKTPECPKTKNLSFAKFIRLLQTVADNLKELWLVLKNNENAFGTEGVQLHFVDGNTLEHLGGTEVIPEETEEPEEKEFYEEVINVLLNCYDTWVYKLRNEFEAKKVFTKQDKKLEDMMALSYEFRDVILKCIVGIVSIKKQHKLAQKAIDYYIKDMSTNYRIFKEPNVQLSKSPKAFTEMKTHLEATKKLLEAIKQIPGRALPNKKKMDEIEKDIIEKAMKIHKSMEEDAMEMLEKTTEKIAGKYTGDRYAQLAFARLCQTQALLKAAIDAIDSGRGNNIVGAIKLSKTDVVPQIMKVQDACLNILRNTKKLTDAQKEAVNKFNDNLEEHAKKHGLAPELKPKPTAELKSTMIEMLEIHQTFMNGLWDGLEVKQH